MEESAISIDEILEAIPPPSRAMAPFRWFGGKGNLAQRIIPLLPKATTYVEPYAGAASVFWHLTEPYPVEVLNDLDDRIVTLFRVLQDRAKFEELAHRLVWTPYSRAEFRRALAILQDPSASDLDRAWAFFVAQNQGFSGEATCEGNWSRVLTASNRGMAETTNRWRGRLKLLASWHDRLMRVQIDSIDALECIRYWDTPNTLFYIDPPYVLQTRNHGGYAHEADDEHHQALVQLLLNIQGKAVLSGYDHPIYKPLEDAGWHKIVIPTASHAAGRIRGSMLRGEGAALAKVPRFEAIWSNVTRSLTLFDFARGP
ncbi:DNA adenine methylase [Meiothermus sp. Pnk-1]|uniref:DNA adenine methylase n=1 Tax=Meiothermus sp. Pnk-1 TaxID=873128 RepID=UPI000D7D2244|nr:DNA adenine methylase [Meiothermus sp. Pnk-1]PZA08277.1 DNA adenine methylase [Meiothermus sp. Pnk-1]